MTHCISRYPFFIALFTIAALGESVYSQPSVSVAGVQVVRVSEGDGMDAIRPFHAQGVGTQLALLIQEKDAAIIELDLEKSKIEAFVDNVGTKLMEAPKAKGFGGNAEGFDSFPRISPDGKTGLVTVIAKGLPAKKATKIGAKGTLVVKLGKGTEKIKSKPFQLEKDVEFKVGDIELKIKSAGKPNFGNAELELTVQTKNDAIESVSEVRFLTESGEELAGQQSGSSKMGFVGKATYTRNYRFQKKPAGAVVVEFEMWSDTETVSVPFGVSAGIGG